MHNPLIDGDLPYAFNGVKQRSTMREKARDPSTEEAFDDQIMFRCYRALRHRIVAIRKREHRRDNSEVIRLLIERGIAAYERDGKLLE